MAETKETWSTRQAANYLGLSTVAMLSKVDFLGAARGPRGYRWPADKVREYERLVAGKALNDPTRNRVFDRP